MRPDRYTVKSQEAIERAQQIARENGHQQLAPEHRQVPLGIGHVEQPAGQVRHDLHHDGRLGVVLPPQHSLGQLDPLEH